MGKKKKKKEMRENENREKEEIKVFIKAELTGARIIAEDNQESRALYDQSRFGEPADNKMQYSLVEGLYLLEKGRMEIKDSKGKKINFDDFVKLASENEPNFWIRYCVYRDIRNRGYIIKTALKFGADFRIYDRGVKPGEDHAKWIVYPVHETSTLTWQDFSAKNRVAHSTRKRLLLGIVDDEKDVTYYECKWTRP